jgi:hypothetical protein
MTGKCVAHEGAERLDSAQKNKPATMTGFSHIALSIYTLSPCRFAGALQIQPL